MINYSNEHVFFENKSNEGNILLQNGDNNFVKKSGTERKSCNNQ